MRTESCKWKHFDYNNDYAQLLSFSIHKYELLMKTLAFKCVKRRNDSEKEEAAMKWRLFGGHLKGIIGCEFIVLPY